MPIAVGMDIAARPPRPGLRDRPPAPIGRQYVRIHPARATDCGSSSAPELDREVVDRPSTWDVAFAPHHPDHSQDAIWPGPPDGRAPESAS